MQIVMAQLSERGRTPDGHVERAGLEHAGRSRSNTPATDAHERRMLPPPRQRRRRPATAPTQAATAAAWLTGDKLNETLGEVAMLPQQPSR
jgi:ribosomal protein S30